MKKMDLGQTVSILANVGVIAGIVFLAVEIRQNQATLEEQNTLTRLTSRDSGYEYFSNFRKLLLENPELHEIWERGIAGEELSSFEKSRVQVLCQEQFWASFTLYNRNTALGMDQERDLVVSFLANQIEQSELVKDCWESQKNQFTSRGYTDFVSSVESLE